MSKAILVIDMPINCYDCPLASEISLDEYEGISDANICSGYGSINFDSYSRPDWCPLKMLKKIENVGFGVETRECGYIDGFNYCIDTILSAPVDVDSFLMEEKVRNGMEENSQHAQYIIAVEKIRDAMRDIRKGYQYQSGKYVIPLQPIDQELIRKYKALQQIGGGCIGNEIEKIPE